MEYKNARIDALQRKIESLKSKIAHLEALIEVNNNNNLIYYNYENE